MTTIVNKYVAGFLYHERRVLLVCKKSPKWQEGLWNGVGGKCELDEAPIMSMHREFKEETTYDSADWRLFCNEVGPDYVVHFFRATLTQPRAAWPLYNDIGESLSWCYLNDLTRLAVVGNLNWLVPLGYDWRGFGVMTFETKDRIVERATW